MVTLMKTKYQMPPLPAGLLRRDNLCAKMEEGLSSDDRFMRKLTLVSAPAGYGKTTAVLQWLDTHRSRVAWVSLDEGDNEGRMFWSYFLRAMAEIDDRVGAESGEYLQAVTAQLPGTGGARADGRRFVQRFVNELALSRSPIIVVLDDYHVIEDCTIHDAMATLLTHLPSTVHLVLVTRADPPLRLGRLRGRGEVSEIRGDDLRFDERAAGQLLRRLTGAELPCRDISRLIQHTEGWVAGLKMLALSLQRVSDPSRLIDDMARENRYIFEYLMDEVLGQQPEEVREFLLQTGPLDSFTPSLCRRVTGMSGARDMIMQLYRRNLFINRLDGSGRWHAYHSLFTTILRHQLARDAPEQLSRILCSAAEWYEEQDMIPDAASALLRAEDHVGAARLLDRWGENLWFEGGGATLLRWLDALPDELVQQYQRLSAIYAFLLLANMRTSRVETFLAAAEGEGPDGEREEELPDSPVRLSPREVRGVTRAVRAHMAGFRGDAEGFLRSARGIMRHFQRRSIWRPIAATVAADAAEWEGDVQQSDQMFRLALEDGWAMKNPFFCLMAGNRLGFMKLRDARLGEATDVVRGQLEFAAQAGFADEPRAGGLWTLMGEVKREQNDLRRSEQLIARGLELSREATVGVRSWCDVCHARLLLSLGRLDEMENLLGQIETSAYGLLAWIDRQVTDLRALMALQRGQYSRAENLLRQHLTAAEPIGPWYDTTHLVGARLHLAGGETGKAHALLQSMLEYCLHKGSRRGRMETDMLMGLSLYAEGQVDAAMEHMASALRVAAPEGYVRLFADEGEAMRGVLAEAEKRGIFPDHVVRLQSAIAQDEVRNDVCSGDSDRGADQLSERELEVLQLLARGHSNRQLAEKLFISENTVKWHTSNIYGKLSAANRTEAVRMARERGIVQ